MTPFSQAHASLSALGYTTVPLIPPSVLHHKGRGKAPGECRSGHWSGLDKWQRLRDSAPSTFELSLWSKAPDANAGLVLGTPAGLGLHVIAVDVDVIDPDAFDEIVRCLPHSPMRKVGAKGMTAFYRAAKTIKTKCYDDARIPRDAGIPRRLVDLLTGFDTRQTVVPPSVHPDGPVYRWLDGPVPAAELPIFDDDALEKLEDTLRLHGWDPEARTSPVRATPPRPAPVDTDDIWSEVKAAAMANLSAWVPALDLQGCRPARGGFEAVATWRPSSSGRPIAERKRNLSIQANGIKDFGTNETYSSIDLVMVARDCDQAEATDWLRERLGLKDDGGVVVALSAPVDTCREEVIDADLPEPLRRKPSAPNLGEIPPIDPETPATPALDVGAQVAVGIPTTLDPEFPDHLTHVPGLVGEITDWISDSARKPQRGGALMAALTLVGTAAGRKFAGPTLTGTHLYGLFLAPSGAAKDHPLKCIGRVLHAATMGQHYGPGGFMSLSAVISRLTRQPLTLSCIDEFGAFLGRINGRRAATHEKAITGILRTAWGSSFDTMAMPEWAGRVGEPVHSPALSLYGVSTHEEFFQGLEGGDVFNGFLNRFLTISTQTRVQEREPKADKMAVPASIVDGMVAIYTSGNPLARASSHMSTADAPMIVVPWADPHAHRAYMALAETVERMEAEQAFYARTVEMAQRLATIRAIGISPSAPRITLEDMDWGAQVALWSARRMAEDAADYMSETQHQGEALRVLRTIGRDWTSFRLVAQAMKHRMRAKDLRDILDGLVDAGSVEVEGRRPESGGHPVKWYRRAR